MDSARPPWYRDNQTEPPFRLTTCLKNLRGLEYRFVSLFPWNLASLHSFKESESYPPEFREGWPKFIETYAGWIVVGSTEELYLIRSLRAGGKQEKQIHLDTEIEIRPITAVAWALSQSSSLNPLLVIAMSSVVCVYSVGHGEPVGFLRGHGGPIHCIAVHPRSPFYICTTSSDQTARIYDLDRFYGAPEENPPYLPGAPPSKAGAPHGIRSSEKEEWGRGLCIAVLVGGRSGGHLAAVTCAAFHPTFPLIATGGVDRVVKIWRVHSRQVVHSPGKHKNQLLREDKPLFSSALIHRSSAASVVWLAEDTLLTHCTSTAFASHIALPTEHPTEATQDESEPQLPELEWFGSSGRIVILRWLGLNRFFPPSHPGYQDIMRGCVSDYQESSSFTVIASVPLPHYPNTPYLRVFGDVQHDHVILVAHPRAIRLLNTSHVPGVQTTEFPADPEQFPTSFAVQSRLRAEEKVDERWLQDNNWVRDLGWCIDLDSRFVADGEDVKVVDMGLNGEMIVAAGSKGSMWIWMKDL